GVCPSLVEKAAEDVARLGTKEGVVCPALWLVDVRRGRDDVVVARQDHRSTGLNQPGGMSDEGFRPGELVLKPRTGRGIPVGQIETTHQDAVDRSLDITALVWVRVAREAPAGRMDGGVPRQDGDPVPALLTEPDRFISDVAQGLC